MSERRPHWDDELFDDRWTGVCESPEEVVRELKQAQAAIQRVREQLHKPWKYECECCTRIWIALEGDSDE